MVVVRLAKSGAKKNPYYFITVADSRKPRDGGYIERLGFFNPSAKGSEERLRFNIERYDHWVTKGAQASDKVSELVKDARLSPEDLLAKLDAKQAKRDQKKEVLAFRFPAWRPVSSPQPYRRVNEPLRCLLESPHVEAFAPAKKRAPLF